MQSNIETVKHLYQLFAAKDNAGVRNIFAPGIVWSQMEGFPNGGTYTGADEIFENVFSGFREHWTSFQTIVTDYLDAGASVIALGYYEGTYAQTGRSVKAAFAHHYQLADRKIIRFTQYTDTHLIAEAMRKTGA
jgi:ketosteroid isomerase-like protein